MPKINLSSIPKTTGSGYPGSYADGFEKRGQQRIGDASGLSQFGANLVTLAPGGMSSLRHWHEKQDEFLVMTAGQLVLVDDHGSTVLNPGDCAAFPAGDANGHHIVNNSDADGQFVVVGTRTETETGWYSDVDMKVEFAQGTPKFTRRDGTPIQS